MNEKKPINIPQEAFDWYDEYAHGLMDRRTFMKKLGGLTALGISMGTLTSTLLPNYLFAEQVSFNDSDIKATYEEFDSPKGNNASGANATKPTLASLLATSLTYGFNPRFSCITITTGSFLFAFLGTTK